MILNLLSLFVKIVFQIRKMSELLIPEIQIILVKPEDRLAAFVAEKIQNFNYKMSFFLNVNMRTKNEVV